MLKAHLILVTKYRKVLLVNNLNEQMKEIIYNILYSEPNYEYHNINHKLSGNCLNVLHKMLEKSQKFGR